MRKMKKALALLLVALQIVVICGCTAGDQAASSQTTETTVVTDPTESTTASEPDEVVMATDGTEPDVEATENGSGEADPTDGTTEPSAEAADPTETEATETTAPTETTVSHEHSYSTSTVKATCTEKGYILHKCSCGDSYKDTYTEATGHSYSKKVTKPTCTKDGYTTYKCDTCGKSYKDNYTDATGHSWGAWKVTKEATTSSEGKKERTCKTCGTTQTETIEKLGIQFWNPDTGKLYDPANELEVEVVRAMFKYINQFRAEEGAPELIWLDGMSQVAEYRSRQLVTNFEHSTADKREALAYYQYGEYIDMTPYGYESYWEAQTQEAIGAGYRYSIGLTADELGYIFANAYRESEGHWRYLGSSQYSYVGIGVTYSNGDWFDCVMVGTVNYG